MIIKEFAISNFFSINDEQLIDLTIAANVPDPLGHFATYQEVPKVRLPRVAIFFGANASGKTTVLRALSFLSHFLRDSVGYPPNGRVLVSPFADKRGSMRPIKLAISFFAALPVGARANLPTLYAYEVELSPNATEVLRESLRYAPLQRTRLLFERDANTFRFGDDFQISPGDKALQRVKSNASLISVLAQFNHPFSVALYEAVGQQTGNVGHFGKLEFDPKHLSQLYATNPSLLESLNGAIRRADFGIDKVEFPDQSAGATMLFRHDGLEAPIAYEFESHGTKRFLEIFPRIHAALAQGSVCVLDELDADVHPAILSEVVGWFRSSRLNPKHAQLFAACHNPTPLDFLLKEEIWFTEKDALGQTSVYGLKSIEGVRRDANVRARYLQGAYGAIPKLA